MLANMSTYPFSKQLPLSYDKAFVLSRDKETIALFVRSQGTQWRLSLVPREEIIWWVVRRKPRVLQLVDFAEWHFQVDPA
jgi:hypothetical protein